MRYLHEFWLAGCDAAVSAARRRGCAFLSRLSRFRPGRQPTVPAEVSDKNSSAAAAVPETAKSDMGWLSLTSDADGPSRHEHDVLCMGIIPDDLDEHDPDGSDLSWIGLVPIEATTHANSGKIASTHAR
jgi:hypothetical protein